MATKLTEISSNKVFGGFQKVYSHESTTLKSSAKFGIFLPPQAQQGQKLPVIYWLSGLTCSEANFIDKAGAQKYASEKNVIIVNPDTSPRNVNVPGDSESWDFGVGAGFYVDAIQPPWKENYNMYSYVTKELIQIINDNFPAVPGKQSIMGHSMGGHGALICALKNPGLYQSVSAFAPICNPSNCPWGIKAFNGYLGPKESGLWSQWDATELVKNYQGDALELFIDQGSDDNFLSAKQLLPENILKSSGSNKNIKVIYKERDGYNHSYFYIATFIGEHISYHAEALR